VRALFARPDAYDAWEARWRARLAQESGTPEERATIMRRANPAFIPRNHLIEAAIRAAVEHDDFAPFETMVRLLSRPFEDDPTQALYASPPKEEERVLQTFCGT
jgi:uncharacterized protein YdiU (UPF0061 family)